jgi:hypothetical protein
MSVPLLCAIHSGRAGYEATNALANLGLADAGLRKERCEHSFAG